MHSLLKSKRFLLGILIAFAVAFAEALGAATRDIERVQVGYSVGGLIPFPVVVARENKFFEHLGLDVELINIPPTLAVTALVSGDLQYVIFAGTTLNAAVRGLPVKLVYRFIETYLLAMPCVMLTAWLENRFVPN
jgi:ABC-type nitrate/sulfonate/bicarbonate transport system substrate-binding protein